MINTCATGAMWRMTPCPAIVRSALPAVLLAALCAWAEPNGHLERVKAMLELQAELEPQKSC